MRNSQGTFKEEFVKCEKSKRCIIKIGPVSGVREILMLWLDNENVQEFNLDDKHELVSSGVIITFKVFTKILESNYSPRFFSSKVLHLDQLNKQPLDFEACVEIDQSYEMIEHMTKETFECILWFIPIVTESMQQQYPISSSESLKVPETSKKVCHTRCPLKAIASLSTAITYKCPWIVSLTKESQDVEMMGAIHISFRNTSPNPVKESLVSLCSPYITEIMNWESIIGEKMNTTTCQSNPFIENDPVLLTERSVDMMGEESKIDTIKTQTSIEVSKNQNKNEFHSSLDALESHFVDNTLDDMSCRNLSSVMRSLDVVTEKVRSNLIGGTNKCAKPEVTIFKGVESSPSGFTQHTVEEVAKEGSQIEAINSISNELKPIKEIMITETKQSQMKKNCFDGKLHQKFSNVITCLSGVTSELQNRGAVKSKTNIIPSGDREYSKQEETQEENLTDEMKSQENQSVIVEKNEASQGSNFCQEKTGNNEVPLTFNFTSQEISAHPLQFASEEKSAHSSIHDSSESSLSLVFMDREERNWENESSKSSSSESSTMMKRSNIFISKYDGSKPSNEEKDDTSLSDVSSTESSLNDKRLIHSRQRSDYSSSSDSSIEKRVDPFLMRRGIKNERLARIMGVHEHKNDSDDESSC